MKRTVSLLSLLLVAAVAFVAWWLRSADSAVPPRVLLVGCSEYPALRDTHRPAVYDRFIRLLGPVNDCALVRSTLIDVLDYDPAEIITLAGWPDDPNARPTHDNILAALDRLAHSANAGERVIIYFAGHGTQTPDLNRDEPDALDEVFLPADVTTFAADTRSIPGALTDDTLGEKVEAIRHAGAFVWLIMDCCHSGTMVRGETDPVRYRTLPPDLLSIPSEAFTEDATSPDTHPPVEHELEEFVALYATQSHCKAAELSLPRRSAKAEPHGLLTFMTARALTRSQGNFTYRDLHREVLAGYQSVPYENAVPLIEGDTERAIASGRRRRADEVHLTSAPDGSWRVDRGSLWGLHVGDQLAPATDANANADGLPTERRWVVESVESRTARARDVGSDDAASAPAAGSIAARVVAAASPPNPLRFVVVDSNGDALPEDRWPSSLREPSSLIEGVTQPDDSDWRVVVRDHDVLLEPSHSGSMQRHHTSKASALAHLERIAKATRLRQLVAKELPSPGEEFALRLWRDPASNPKGVEPGETLTPGDRVEIELVVSKDATQPYDLTLLLIDADHGVHVVFPNANRSARLTAGESWRSGVIPVNDETVGLEHLVLIGVPRRESDPVVDLSWLEQPRLAGPTRSRHQGEPAIVSRLAQWTFGPTRGDAQSSPERDSTEARGLLLSWRTEWPELVRPRFPERAGKPIPFEALQDSNATPDNTPWLISPERAVTVPVVTSGMGRTWWIADRDSLAILVDLDLDSAQLEAHEVRAAIENRTIDLEFAFRFDPGRRLAYFDRDNDGEFDRVLIDDDADPWIDRELVLRDGRWTEQESDDGLWFRTAYVGEYGKAFPVIDAVRAVFAPTEQ